MLFPLHIALSRYWKLISELYFVHVVEMFTSVTYHLIGSISNWTLYFVQNVKIWIYIAPHVSTPRGRKRFRYPSHCPNKRWIRTLALLFWGRNPLLELWRTLEKVARRTGCTSISKNIVAEALKDVLSLVICISYDAILVSFLLTLTDFTHCFGV